MTREEAERVLWRVAYDKYGPDDNPMRQREAADIVVTALRGSADKTERQCMANQCVACGRFTKDSDLTDYWIRENYWICKRCKEKRT